MNGLPVTQLSHLERNTNILLLYIYRGGVLEPAGTVEIKFRRREIIKAMKRLDSKYQSLSEKLTNTSLTVEQKVCYCIIDIKMFISIIR